jgi:hypothetical protein
MNKINARIIEADGYFHKRYIVEIQKKFMFWTYWKRVLRPGSACFYEFDDLDEAKTFLEELVKNVPRIKIVYSTYDEN